MQVNDVVFNFDNDQVRVRVDRWMAGVAIRCIDSVLVNPGDDAKKNLKDNPNKDTGSPRSYIVAFVKISSHSLLNLSPLYRQVADYMWRTNLSSRGSVAVKHLPSVEVSGCLEVGEVGQNAQGRRKGKQIDILQVDIVILHIVWVWAWMGVLELSQSGVLIAWTVGLLVVGFLVGGLLVFRESADDSKEVWPLLE